MKKITLFFLALLLLNNTVLSSGTSSDYSWAQEAVSYCKQNNILLGNEKGDMMLGDNVTEAQALAFIARSFDIDVYVSGKYESMISSSHWAFETVKSMSGYLPLPDEFKADEPATREMFISWLISAIGITNYSDDAATLLKEKFRDVSKCRIEYIPFLNTASDKNILQGADNKINPKGYLTRAEAVTLIHRSVKILNNEKVSTYVAPQSTEEAVVEQPAEIVDTEPKEIIVTDENKIVGEAQITLEHAKKWAIARGAHQRFIDIADTYWKYGALFGIRPEVLYAQAAKETNFGKYGGRVLPEMNNWAGIKKYGATGDATEDHESFATPDDGVRGHFNHMSAYVGVNPIGEPHGRYFSVKSLSWAGTVKAVEELGAKWCPDSTYGTDILRMMSEMKSH